MALSLSGLGPAARGAEPENPRDWRFSGDVRVRLEQDWDSHLPDGSERDDRLRLRLRGHLAFTYDPANPLFVGVRLRSGATENQQSPLVTVKDFDGNPVGDWDADLDQWYVGLSRGRSSGWIGRNQTYFWKQDEFLWDDDATPVGLAFRHGFGSEQRRLEVNLGGFTMPDGMREVIGLLAGAQAVYSHETRTADWKAAAALYSYAGEDGAENLTNGNGARDYLIFQADVQAEFRAAGEEWSAGVEVLRNLGGYSAADPDPFTVANREEKNGYALLLDVGGVERAGDWLAGYRYAHIETLAVIASFAQDDWVRWGTPTQIDGSDLEGHELRAGWAFSGRANVILRVFIVDAITSVQDGKRARLDFNYSF